MILTYKVKHNSDLSEELLKGLQVARYAVKTKSRTSKDVAHLGLKSVISNQILKKYSSNKRIKRVTRVKLTLPHQGIKLENKIVIITSLKLSIPFDKEVLKINQLELDLEYAYISCTVPEEFQFDPTEWIGVDLNATSHCLVASNSSTGKVWKLGKKANHVHKKFKNIRTNLQKKKKFNAVKNIKNKESRIVRDLNHKIARKLVEEAKKHNAGIVLEDLKGIRKTKKQNKSFKYSLHSWSFYQLGIFILYTSKLLGVPVVYIDPHYTSQQCSKCGLLGERSGKLFKCPHCGHVDHADVNASFVIGLRHRGVIRSITDRDVIEGVLATPDGQCSRREQPRTPRL